MVIESEISGKAKPREVFWRKGEAQAEARFCFFFTARLHTNDEDALGPVICVTSRWALSFLTDKADIEAAAHELISQNRKHVFSQNQEIHEF